MSINKRNYQGAEDYRCLSEFLIAHHLPGNADGNWLEPMWEYMHYHPNLDQASLGKIGIWELGGETVGVVHYEGRLGEVFFQFHPAHRQLREEMLDYAEKHLAGISRKDGRKYLCAFVHDADRDFQELVQARGYQVFADESRPLDLFSIPDPFPAIPLPEGYRLTSLAEECDWAKVHQVLWRGFDHGDDVPMNDEEYESRRRMFETPKARLDLKIAVAAPDGSFASFCGMFLEPEGRYCYVEPVATDPRHRRLGLGKAAVLEGIRRCARLGATEAFVGNDLPVYQAVGFKKMFTSECWVKWFE